MNSTTGTVYSSHDMDSVVRHLNASNKVKDMKERKHSVSVDNILSKVKENKKESADKETKNDEDSNEQNKEEKEELRKNK